MDDVMKTRPARKVIINDLYDRVKTTYNDLAYVWGEMNSLSSWNSWSEFSRNIELIRDLYPRIVSCVEYCSNQIMEETKLLCTSAEKRAAAKQFFDDLVQLNGLSEMLSDWLIDCGVELAVKALNEKYGKDWGITSVSDIVTKSSAIAAEARESRKASENGKN